MSSPLPAFDASSHPKYTSSPNPTWTYGAPVSSTALGRSWLEGEKQGWTVHDASQLSAGEIYPLLLSGILPRPVAFVSTISESGVENLAPFSWFNQVSPSPPLISLCPSNLPRIKDTTANILATKGFTVNIISEPFVEQANVTSVDAPEGVGEWAMSGLTKAPSVHVKASRVRESAFSIECELFQSHPIIHPTTHLCTATLILGLVKYIHVRNDVLTPKGTVDPIKLRAVGRMGDVSYARTGDLFRLTRPVWEREGGGDRGGAQGEGIGRGRVVSRVLSSRGVRGL